MFHICHQAQHLNSPVCTYYYNN